MTIGLGVTRYVYNNPCIKNVTSVINKTLKSMYVCTVVPGENLPPNSSTIRHFQVENAPF